MKDISPIMSNEEAADCIKEIRMNIAQDKYELLNTLPTSVALRIAEKVLRSGWGEDA